MRRGSWKEIRWALCACIALWLGVILFFVGCFVAGVLD